MAPITDVPIETWEDCYDKGWKGLIVDEAFQHPAKMARGLVVRIFDELIRTGALTPGDTVLDPFGGIGTTEIEGASRGMRVVCVELEPKFVALAVENVLMHRRRWEAMGRPVPVVLQGDSRRLRAVLLNAASAVVSPGEVDAVVSSPPYEGNVNSDRLKTDDNKLRAREARAGFTQGAGCFRSSEDAYGDTPGQLGQMDGEGGVDAVVSSPPFMRSDTKPTALGSGRPTRADGDNAGRNKGDYIYGSSEGQLVTMPEGDGIDAIVSSPPFAQPYTGGGGINTRGYGPDGADKVGARTYQALGGAREDGNLETLPVGEVDAVVSSPPWGEQAEGAVRADKFRNPADFLKAGRGHGCPDEARLRQLERDRDKTYGDSDGQLAGLPMGDAADALVTSPPYEGSLHVREDGIDWQKARRTTEGGGEHQRPGVSVSAAYPENADNIGNATGETFWTAAKQIVAECHAVLKPGGYAVFVVKMFVRDRKLVDFPSDWRRLCEHVGFETVKEVRATLITRWEEHTLFDGTVQRERKRASFFRRLAEAKGSPRVDWETVWFMRKPQT